MPNTQEVKTFICIIKSGNSYSGQFNNKLLPGVSYLNDLSSECSCFNSVFEARAHSEHIPMKIYPTNKETSIAIYSLVFVTKPTALLSQYLPQQTIEKTNY